MAPLRTICTDAYPPGWEDCDPHTDYDPTTKSTQIETTREDHNLCGNQDHHLFFCMSCQREISALSNMAYWLAELPITYPVQESVKML